MKLKEYFSSLISRRKSNTSSKSHKPKSHHQSISSTDCHYEICANEDANKAPIDNRHTRTQILLTRHAQLVNTIIGIRSQENLCTSCPHCRSFHQSQETNVFLNRNYSSTLATCHPTRECQSQTIITASNTSLSTKARQRSKIRTNPWIQTNSLIKQEYSTYVPTSSSTLIHSESFPQTLSNGNIHAINSSNKTFHQSDSGHGFSLASSRVVDSSSSPDNTSFDGALFDEKQHVLYANQTEQYFHSKTTMSSDNRKKIRKSAQAHYQRSSKTRISTSPKKSMNRPHHAHSSSPRLSNDHFSIKFEEIVENEFPHKQHSSSTRKSPFILPLDEPDVKHKSQLPISYSPTNLIKTNSRTILKHIEEIENEIRMIKNLNFDNDKQLVTSMIDAKQDERQTIYEQVDQWVEKCLINTDDNSTNLLHKECNNLSDTIKDYVTCVCSNDNGDEITSIPKSQTKTELMTVFYVSTIPRIQRAFSFNDQSKSQTFKKDLKFMHECPF